MVIQPRLKKNAVWIDAMKKAVRSIKDKIKILLPLALPQDNLPFILETYASNHVCATVLLQKQNKKEEVCAYTLGTFSDTE